MAITDTATHALHALEEYTVVKHVVFELTGAPRRQWHDAASSR